MPIPRPNFSENALFSCRNEEDYLIHCAALEWTISDPIIIQGPEDIKSKVNWRDTLEPFHHQVQNLITFCKRLPVTLLADDVGLGKTISAGLILSELMFRRRVNKALIICPKILGNQWKEELKLKFGIESEFAVGVKKFQEALALNLPVIITTYNTGSTILYELKKNPFDMLILDEAHKLRNLFGTPKKPKMALSVMDALEKRLFRFVLMLTATPIQNRVWDIYSLIHLLTIAKGHKNPLGTAGEFSAKFIDGGSNGRKFKPNVDGQFRALVRDYIVRTRREDANLQFPEREVLTYPINLSPEETQVISIMSEDLHKFYGLEQSSLAEALMSSPDALIDQLKGMAEKNYKATVLLQKIVEALPYGFESSKQKGVIKLCNKLKNQNKDWRLIIFTKRIATLEAIGKSLNREGIEFGFIRGGQFKKNQETINNFRSDPPQINVIVSTDAGAEGVNLQSGNVLLNFDLPWNPMVVEQRIGRIQRLASKHAKVEILNMFCANTVEERIVNRLLEKLQTISHAVGNIESILEATNYDDDEDFETQIQEMVVRSLIGQDTEKDVQLKLESIQKAKEKIESEKEFLENILGTPEGSHEIGPQVPRFIKSQPTMSFKDFSLLAKKALGLEIQETSPGIFEATKKGKRSEIMVFDERLFQDLQTQSVFMGNVNLYQPGKTDFERLVQHWVDKCGHYVMNTRDNLESKTESLARKYCSSYKGLLYQSYSITEKTEHFQGTVIALAKASNGIDAFEKITISQYVPNNHPAFLEIDFNDPPLKERLKPSDIFKNVTPFLEKKILEDSDLNHFCDFYDKRLEEELQASGGEPHLQKKHRDNFESNILVEIAGLNGHQYQEVNFTVTFTKDEKGPYTAHLTGIPYYGSLLSKPLDKKCAITEDIVPDTCLSKCEVTGSEVLNHLLEASESSGRKGIPEKFTTCEISNKKVLEDEVEVSTKSGSKALKEFFVTCQVTNARILEQESAQSSLSKKIVDKDILIPSAKNPDRVGLLEEHFICQESGISLLEDEVAKCEATGLKVDTDLLQKCAVTEKLALIRILKPCEVSGNLCLPESLEICFVSRKTVNPVFLQVSEVSGIKALPEHLSSSDVSGKIALINELVTCQISGKKAIPNEMETCSITGTIGIREEMVQCKISGEYIVKEESGRSDVSGLLVKKTLLMQSKKPPHRLGLENEIGICKESGKLFLLDEMDKSQISGKLVDKELLVKCSITQKIALKSELVKCQETGEYFHRDETGECAYSSIICRKDLLAKSEISFRPVLERYLKKCEITNKFCILSEMGICDITGKHVAISQLGTCQETNKRVIWDLLGQCSITYKTVLVEMLGTSSFSGVTALKSLLIPSGKTATRFGLESEMVTCEVTGKRLLIDETATSAHSFRVADLDLFDTSDASGRLALKEEMKACEISGIKLLPIEAGTCAESSRLVDIRMLQECEETKQQALPEFFSMCGITNKRVISSKMVECGITKIYGLKNRMTWCEHSNQFIIPKRAVICQATEKVIADIYAGRSDFSGRIVLATLLIASEKIPYRKGIQSEIQRCEVTQKLLLMDELGLSDWSGKKVDKAFLIRSKASDRFAVRNEMVECAETKSLLLPDEVLKCSVTEKVIDKRLLIRSELSGEYGLKKLSGYCEVTKKLVLLKELRICAFTKMKVIAKELVPCAITGKLGARTKMLQSSVSGKYVNPDNATRSVYSDLIGLKNECQICSWYGQAVLKNELAICSLTKLHHCKDFLNNDSELAALRNLMDERSLASSQTLLPNTKSPWQGIHLLQEIDPTFFKTATNIWVTKGPNTRYAVCVELKQWFGMSSKFVGFIVDATSDAKIIGRGVLGTASNNKIVIEQEIVFTKNS
jgi:superfamily II DNA or RNA helicase